MKHFSILPLFVLIALTLSQLASPARADDADWSAGIATVRITPEKPVVLAGYAARIKPFQNVEQDIDAKALALKDAQGHTAVLVTMDLCTLPPDVANPVRERIAEKAHLDAAQVVLSVSHTHSAPVVALSAGDELPQPPPHAQETAAYTRSLQDKLVAVAVSAFQQMQPARLSWGTGVADFVMNRRQFTDKGIILGVNPSGIVDRSVPVMRIGSTEGKLRAVLFAYACHNTTLPSNYLAVSGDYAGYAKAYVQQQFPGAEALFMMGCGGDANPYPREQIPLAKVHGEELGKEVCRILGTKLQKISGPLTCAGVTAQLPLQTPTRDALQELSQRGPGYDKGAAQQLLGVLDRGQQLAGSYAAPVVVWQFGADLTLVCLPDEVVVGYVQDLQDAIGPLRLWVAGYCNEVAGYVPTRRILEQGGYETRGLYFGAGFFALEVEQVLVSTARDAAIKAGRPPISRDRS